MKLKERINIDFEEFFSNGKFDFQKRKNNIGQTTVNLELQNSVGLGFYLEEKKDENYEKFIERFKNTNQDVFKLGSFSLMRK